MSVIDLTGEPVPGSLLDLTNESRDGVTVVRCTRVAEAYELEK